MIMKKQIGREIVPGQEIGKLKCLKWQPEKKHWIYWIKPVMDKHRLLKIR